MKNITLTLVIIITFGINLFAQGFIKLDAAKYKYTFLLTYQPDSTDIEHTEQEKMLLLVGDSISEFISSGSYKQDSVYSFLLTHPQYFQSGSHINSNELFGGSYPYTHFKDRIFKNFPLGKITVTERLLSDAYKYNEPTGLFNWKITDNTKKIGEFLCQEARCYYAGRYYTAWFTNEIPVSEGPYKFTGLPGFIVVLYDSKNQYKFELLRIEKLTDPIDIKIIDKKYIIIDKKEFFKIKKEFYKNIFERMENSGIFFGDPVTNKEKQKAINKRNNPIELKTP